jgi:hypothetical protein
VTVSEKSSSRRALLEFDRITSYLVSGTVAQLICLNPEELRGGNQSDGIQ